MSSNEATFSETEKTNYCKCFSIDGSRFEKYNSPPLLFNFSIISIHKKSQWNQRGDIDFTSIHLNPLLLFKPFLSFVLYSSIFKFIYFKN